MQPTQAYLNGHGAPLSQVWARRMRAVPHASQAAFEPGLPWLHLPANVQCGCLLHCCGLLLLSLHNMDAEIWVRPNIAVPSIEPALAGLHLLAA